MHQLRNCRFEYQDQRLRKAWLGHKILGMYRTVLPAATGIWILPMLLSSQLIKNILVQSAEAYASLQREFCLQISCPIFDKRVLSLMLLKK